MGPENKEDNKPKDDDAKNDEEQKWTSVTSVPARRYSGLIHG
jgi:hypothetical protein